MLTWSDQPVESLYVHVPFCAHKCEYCAFFSQTPNGEAVNRYVRALVREMELVAHDLEPATIFFGGGTPSLLTLKQWEEVLQAMERLNLLGAAEWTVECNPATVSPDKAGLLRRYGVNRISMGVQSLDEALLDRLGRIHSREMVFKSFDTLRDAGFDNINIDLMFAIPGQTMEIWRETLREAVAFGSEHLSCYEVIYEADTPLFEQLKAGRFSVDEDLACDLYEALVDFAGEKGFQQYEIANFAREKGVGNIQHLPRTCASTAGPTTPPHHSTHPFVPSLACRHNINYWRGGSFHGLGPSATGYVRGVRTRNWSNTVLYCEQLERGQRAIEFREELPPLARAGETAAFGLRMTAGWPFQTFHERTGYDLRAEWKPEIQRLMDLGYGAADETGFRLTRRGLRFADWAAEQFLRIP